MSAITEFGLLGQHTASNKKLLDLINMVACKEDPSRGSTRYQKIHDVSIVGEIDAKIRATFSDDDMHPENSSIKHIFIVTGIGEDGDSLAEEIEFDINEAMRFLLER